jgi:methanogenic corrinoid protein MtbC1
MGKQSAAIDLETFDRAASLFVHKRRVLPENTLELLASDIVRRLARTVKTDNGQSRNKITPEAIAPFCDMLVADGPEAALQFIDARRAEGATRKDIYLGYIGAAASELGKRWDEDWLTFADVTIATGQLYALMRALRDEQAEGSPDFDIRRRALFATVPGEDHGIGITIAADMFRGAGWEIDLQIGADHEALMAHIEQTRPKVVGLSLSTEGRLAELLHLILSIRIALPRTIVGVAPGAGLDPNLINDTADIDLLFTDAASAMSDLDRLIQMPS